MTSYQPSLEAFTKLLFTISGGWYLLDKKIFILLIKGSSILVLLDLSHY